MNIRYRLLSLLLRGIRQLGYEAALTRLPNEFPVLRQLDCGRVEILADAAFQDSCRSLGNTTVLDTPRLANIWNLCRLTDPAGAMLEVGAYRGGCALHMSNCCPDRQVVACDPFDGECFEVIDPELDGIFRKGVFADTSRAEVEKLLRGRNARVVKGYFPASVRDLRLPPISFAHIDVDVYKAAKESLLYLLTEAPLCGRSLIVLDDFKRQARGIDLAVSEILNELKGVSAFPLFPAQALVVRDTWFSP